MLATCDFCNITVLLRLLLDGLSGGAFLLCSRNKSSLHIIGIACVKEWQHKGVGSYLLSEAIKIARKEGYPLITTRSKAGADFYVRKGFDVTGMKGGDFLLELKLN